MIRLKRVTIHFITLLLLLPALASAGEFYLSGGGGVSWEEDANIAGGRISFDPGRTFQGAIGYRHTFDGQGDLKIEVEYLDIRSSQSSFQPIAASRPNNKPWVADATRSAVPRAGVLEESVFMFNAYFVAPVDFPIKPYIGAGGGDDRYQFMAGLETTISENISLSAQFRNYNGQSDNVIGVLTYYFK